MQRMPSLVAYKVKDRGAGKTAIWTRVGAAWPFEAGNGFTLLLDAIPIDGRIILCEPKDEESERAAPKRTKRSHA